MVSAHIRHSSASMYVGHHVQWNGTIAHIFAAVVESVDTLA